MFDMLKPTNWSVVHLLGDSLDCQVFLFKKWALYDPPLHANILFSCVIVVKRTEMQSQRSAPSLLPQILR